MLIRPAAHAGALYGVCPEACLYYFGLSWWAVWFQFIILLASVPVGVRTSTPQSVQSSGHGEPAHVVAQAAECAGALVLWHVEIFSIES